VWLRTLIVLDTINESILPLLLSLMSRISIVICLIRSIRSRVRDSCSQYLIILLFHAHLLTLKLYSLAHPVTQNGLLLLSMNSFVVLH